MKLEELYRLLGLSPGAGIDDIKEAYRKIAKRCHPDVNPNPKNTEFFTKATEAYRELVELKRKRGLVDFPVREAFRARQARKEKAPEKSLFELGEMAVTASSASIRAFAARSLGNTGRISAYVYLRKALFDRDPMVVKSAVRAVGSLRIVQSAGELAAVFSRGDAGVKREILAAIREIGHIEKFRSVLLEGSRDRDPAVRRESQRILRPASGEAAAAQ